MAHALFNRIYKLFMLSDLEIESKIVIKYVCERVTCYEFPSSKLDV